MKSPLGAISPVGLILKYVIRIKVAYATTKTDVRQMFGTIASRYDLTNTALSMGIDALWRRSLVGGITPGVERGLDLCTGTGVLLPALQPKCRELVGADFCLPMLQNSNGREAASSGLVQADALSLPFSDNSFDFVTAAFGVRNFENTLAGLKEIHRVLKPGGAIHILEFGQPRGIFGALFRFYSKWVMPNIGGLITGNKDAYTYLPQTSARFPCGDAFRAMLLEAGFAAREIRPLTGGISWIYRAEKPL